MSARNEKLFDGPNQTRFRFTGLFILMKELLPKNLDTLLFSRRTICELKDKNTFPKVREGDSRFHRSAFPEALHEVTLFP